MSSILEALRELEGGEAPTTPDAEPWTGGPGPLRRALPALVIVGCLALAGGGAFVWSQMRGAPAPPPPVAEVPVAEALPPAAAAPVPSASVLDAEPPRARLAAKTPAPPVVAPAVERAPVARTAGRAASAPADTPRPRAPRPSGEPLVHVASIGYSPVAEQRLVTLSVNGGPVAALHEGESASGIEVQLILPGSVYVRHAGQIFAVDAGR